MYLISLISLPLGYCRLSQKYVLDLSDFLLVEIFLFLLVLIMAKGIFYLKLSKIQFALLETKSAAKYYEAVDGKNNLKTIESRTLYRTLRSASKKSLSRVSNVSFSSEADYKTAYRSLLTSLGHHNVKTSTSSNLQFDNYVNHAALDHSLKTVNVYDSFGSSPPPQPLEDVVAVEVSTAKEVVKLSSQGFILSVKSENLSDPLTPSNTTYSVQESLVNSSNTTYSVLNATEQPGLVATSKSQGSDPDKKSSLPKRRAHKVSKSEDLLTT